MRILTSQESIAYNLGLRQKGSRIEQNVLRDILDMRLYVKQDRKSHKVIPAWKFLINARKHRNINVLKQNPQRTNVDNWSLLLNMLNAYISLIYTRSDYNHNICSFLRNDKQECIQINSIIWNEFIQILDLALP